METTTLNGYQQAAIKAKARETAQMFVDEFNEVLDPATTDWDGTAWQEDVSNLPFELSSEQRDAGWEIYQAELIAETERLCEEDGDSE